MEKEFHLGKGFTGCFPPRQAASAVPQPIFAHKPSLPPVTSSPSLTDRARLSELFSQILPAWRPRVDADKN
jgi:hypothetical protein